MGSKNFIVWLLSGRPVLVIAGMAFIIPTTIAREWKRQYKEHQATTGDLDGFSDRINMYGQFGEDCEGNIFQSRLPNSNISVIMTGESIQYRHDDIVVKELADYYPDDQHARLHPSHWHQVFGCKAKDSRRFIAMTVRNLDSYLILDRVKQTLRFNYS